MHDLRKKALLESGKTTSRKKLQNQRTGSGATTPSLSRAASAMTSRNASDDEDDDYSNDGLNNLDSLVANLPADVWTADLDSHIDAICDRKHSATEGREEVLNAFSNLITYHYAQEELQPRVSALLPALVKCIKSGESAREIELALRAICLIMVTDASDDIYAAVHDAVQSAAEDSQYAEAKVAAIRALSIVQFFSDHSLEESEETMDFLLDIVSTDGLSVGEEENAGIVVAALEAWGFLATQFDELPDSAESALDIFTDQLSSSYTEVVSASGENIALLVEVSYAQTEDDGQGDDDAEDETKIRSHSLDHQARRVANMLGDLSKQSYKGVAKRDRKTLQSSIGDVLRTVEDPRRGPAYSTALDDHGNEVGSRIKVAINNSGGKIVVDEWRILLRVNALKRLLQAGFMAHYKFNANVYDVLPAATTTYGYSDSDRPQYSSKHMRHIADLLDGPDE